MPLAEAKSLNITVLSSDAIQELITKRNKANINRYKVALDGLSIAVDHTGAIIGSWGTTIPLNAPQFPNDATVALMPWKNGYARPLDSSTQWFGAFAFPGSSSAEPIVLDVTHFSPSGDWHGTMTLPAQANTFQVAGVLIPGGGLPMENGELSHLIYIHITHNVSTSRDPRFHDMRKQGHLDTCSRTIKFDTISLTYVRHVPTIPLAFLQPGTIWKGTSATEMSPFKLDITTTNNSGFDGTVSWTELDAKSSCKGSFDPDGSIHFRETGIISEPMGGPIDLPKTQYIVRPIPQLITDPKTFSFSGTWNATYEFDDTPAQGSVLLKPV
jgi:hypothetical protein